MANSNELSLPDNYQVAPLFPAQHLFACKLIHAYSFSFTYDTYSSLTIADLENELKKRNARLSGRKKELIERFLD
jgi:hypothetical protein